MTRDQVRTEEIQDYEVVGATLAPEDDELPMRLRPVMRTRAEPHAYVLLYEQDGDEVLVPETRDFIEERFAEDRFYRFPIPLQARPGHWLIQVEAGRPPEYLLAEDAQRLVREQGKRALRAGARAASAGRLSDARERVAYAVRALHEDPLPILALIALGREELSESQIELDMLLLHDFARADIQQRFREARGDTILGPLVERIRHDPVCTEYSLIPSWLPAKRSSAGVLPKDMWRSPAAA